MYSGDVMELDEDGAAVTGKVHTGAIMVDGLGVGDVGNIVLRDRQHLSEDGIMVVVLTLEKRQTSFWPARISYPAVSSMYANPRI